MEKDITKNCCEGCKSGQLGNNPSCKAKLLADTLKSVMPPTNEENNIIK